MKPIEAAIITTHIDPALGYGGPAVSAAVLTTALAKMGRELVLCSSNASDQTALTPKDVDFGENVNVILYPCQWFKRWGFSLRAIALIFNVCRKAPTVYINGIATWPTSLAAVWCSVMKRRFVVSLRGGLMTEHIHMLRQKKIHKWIYYQILTLPTLRCSAAIHCTSSIEADAAKQFIDKRPNVAVIPNGIDTESIKPKSMPRCDGLILCYAGRISIEKGINEFIRAWLNRKRPIDKLIVVGSGYGRYFRQFLMLVEKSRGAIIYRGYLDRKSLMASIGDSHIVILPSGIETTAIRENFGNTVAEAFALGRPVMVSRGLAWDHVESKHIGFLFDRDFESVCNTITRIQNVDRRTLQQMGDAARVYAKKNLNAYVLATKLWAVVKDT